MNTLLKRTCLGLSALVLAIAWPIGHARQVAVHEGVTASTNNRPDWCQARVDLIVKADGVAVFQGDQVGLQLLFGKARFELEEECPAATEVQIIGFNGNAQIFSATARKAAGWRLEEAPVASSPAAPSATAAAPLLRGPASTVPDTSEPTSAMATSSRLSARQCDVLGAHPEDPDAVVTGVRDQQLDANRVIAACERVAKEYPKAPRLAFQLARGYLKAGQVAQAVDPLVGAAKLGHAGALAYLGELHMDGAPGLEPDPATAFKLLTRAAANGFAPAKALVAEFEDFTVQSAAADAEEARTLAQQDRQPAGNATKVSRNGRYKSPEIVDNVLTGTLDAVPFNERYVKNYLLEIADAISVSCDETHFTERQVMELRQASVLKTHDFSPGGGIAAIIGIANDYARQIRNPVGYLEEAGAAGMDTQLMPKEARHDADVLLDRHACGSPALNEFSKNLVVYVRGDGVPRQSADEMLNRCRRNAGFVRPGDATNFCACFVGIASRAPMTRADRGGLVTDFQSTMNRLMSNQRDRFGMCTQ